VPGSLASALVSHPAVLFVVVAVVVLGVHRLAGRQTIARVHDRAVIPAALPLLAFCALTIWYTFQPAYFDAAEPTIPAVAAAFARGAPLYPALDAPERYAHVYGPVLFLIHALAIAIAGPGMAVSKAVGAAAALASLAAGYRVLMSAGTFRTALCGTATCAAVYMAFGNVTFWTRSDPLLLLCVSAALLAAEAPGGRSCVWMGVAAGLALNLKLTGPLYLAPAAAMLWVRHGRVSVWRMALIGALVGAAPFALQHVSLRHYVQYLALSAGNGIVPLTLRQNLEWSLLLCAPLAFVLRGAGRQRAWRAGVAAVVPALLLVSVAASKPGGGPFHLIPFVPTVVFLVLSGRAADQARASGSAGLLALVLTALVIAVPRQTIFLETVRGRDLSQALAEVRAFIQAHPGSRPAIGYAGTSHLSHVRPEVVFHSRRYLLDAPAVQEHRLAGLALPASTLQVIATCGIPVWLIPAAADQQVFSVPSAYAPKGPPRVFPEEFRALFLRRYARTSSTGLFDVWTCRPSPAS
jgi:hypothetical protein